MAVYQMLYVSGSTGAVSDADLDDILAKSRANNAAAGITGMLLFGQNTFVQVLEGDKQQVRKLAGRISADRRHRNFMVLMEQEAPARCFAAWEMGFKRLDVRRAADKSIFKTTRAALENRISRQDGGLMLDAVLAFGRDFMAEA